MRIISYCTCWISWVADIKCNWIAGLSACMKCLAKLFHLQCPALLLTQMVRYDGSSLFFQSKSKWSVCGYRYEHTSLTRVLATNQQLQHNLQRKFKSFWNKVPHTMSNYTFWKESIHLTINDFCWLNHESRLWPRLDEDVVGWGRNSSISPGNVLRHAVFNFGNSTWICIWAWRDCHHMSITYTWKDSTLNSTDSYTIMNIWTDLSTL